MRGFNTPRPPAQTRISEIKHFCRSCLSLRGAFFAALCCFLLWSYWPTLQIIFGGWSRDPIHNQFGPSHGAFVPIFALAAWWSRRNLWAEESTQMRWFALAFLLPALAMRVLAGAMDWVTVDAFTLLPTMAGVILLAAGRPALRRAWPAIAIFSLALPWPYAVELAANNLLRHIAAAASTYAAQVLGIPAFAEGTTIHMQQTQLNIIDQCSGLGMLLTLVALSATVAALVPRPLLDRILLVMSAALIAIIANIVRITATAVVYWFVADEGVRFFLHELAGWLMMPFALGLLWIELQYLKWLFVPVDPAETDPLAVSMPFTDSQGDSSRRVAEEASLS